MVQLERAAAWMPYTRFGALALGVAVVACGGGQTDALKREVSELREQVTQLQGAQDHLEERLFAMEAQGITPAAKRSEEPPAEERPRLKVVRLTPEAQANEEPAQEDAFDSNAEEDSSASEPKPKGKAKE